jgi:hypothetical protein
MDIEQLPPNKPNFAMVLAVFCVTILVVFLVALLFVRVDGGHLTFRHHRAHPNSQLRLSSGVIDA